MAFKLAKKIFSYFPRSFQVNDSYKDLEGKGFMQRYNELLAENLDSNELGMLENFLPNVVDAETMSEKFIEYKELQSGIKVPILQDYAFRRKFLKYNEGIRKIKGTIPSYEMVFSLLGFEIIKSTLPVTALPDGSHYYVWGNVGDTATVSNGTITTVYHAGDRVAISGAGYNLTTVTGVAYLHRQTVVEAFDDHYSFDSPVTFDDPVRTFDMQCQPCSTYRVELYGNFVLTQSLFTAIFRAIDYVEPINAKLSGVYFNGNSVLTGLIQIWIDENGDLNYINDIDPGLTITLSADGDLYFNGTNAGKYTLDSNGDIQYLP